MVGVVVPRRFSIFGLKLHRRPERPVKCVIARELLREAYLIQRVIRRSYVRGPDS